MNRLVVGSVIRRLRLQEDLKQEELAGKAEIDTATVSRIERGKQNFTPTSLEAIANALNTTSAEILAEAEGAAIKRSSQNQGVELSQDDAEMLAIYKQLSVNSRSLFKLLGAELARNQVSQN